MSWGLGGWGTIPWGDGQTTGSTVVASGPRVACADVMARDLLLLTFSVPMANNAALKAKSNYTISPLDTTQIAPQVLDVLTGNTRNPQQIFLVVDSFVVGQTYSIVVNSALRAVDNTQLDTDGYLAQFAGRRTKIDNIVGSRPQMYDTRPRSLLRTLLNAIGREDDIIGGSRNDRIPCFIHTTSVDPYINQVNASLAGLYWALPSLGNASPDAIFCASSTSASAIIIGQPGATYNVTLRFRGVVEQKTYTGGTNDGAFYQIGGTPAVDTYNIYSLAISNPAQTVYLNRGSSGQTRSYGIDYTKTIQMATGATVTLLSQSIDSQEIKNKDGVGSPISVSGVTVVSQPYDGQFIQMDVVSIVKV